MKSNKKLIEVIKSINGKNGYCLECQKHFKKNDYIIVLDKLKLNKLYHRKICVYCYLKLIADKIGWSKINKIIIKNSVDKI